MPIDLKQYVLVVDDFATMRRIVTSILQQIGFEHIVEAEDGVQALKILESQKIDFVITDWNMPEMSGLDLVKAIREKATKEELPILMVTAEALQENIVAAARAGVNNYIVKPFDAETLSEKIKKILG